MSRFTGMTALPPPYSTYLISPSIAVHLHRTSTPASERLKMVSARPAPKVVGGRTAYPTYQTYTPGEAGEQPESTSPKPVPISIGSPPRDGIERVMSNESDKAGLMTWFKGFRDRSASEPQRMGMSAPDKVVGRAGADGRYEMCIWGTIK